MSAENAALAECIVICYTKPDEETLAKKDKIRAVRIGADSELLWEELARRRGVLKADLPLLLVRETMRAQRLDEEALQAEALRRESAPKMPVESRTCRLTAEEDRLWGAVAEHFALNHTSFWEFTLREYARGAGIDLDAVRQQALKDVE